MIDMDVDIDVDVDIDNNSLCHLPFNFIFVKRFNLFRIRKEKDKTEIDMGES